MKSLYIAPSKHNNHFNTKFTQPGGVRAIGKHGKFIPIPKSSFMFGKRKHSFQLSRQGADLLLIERVSGHSIKTGF